MRLPRPAGGGATTDATSSREILLSSTSSGRAVGRHWVVIETGANQAYIFASNKQAVNVGASELIRQVGTEWVREAVAELASAVPDGPEVEPIVAASGKALLLVDSPDTGREVIRTITRRAMSEAPRLEVWGVVDAAPIADVASVGAALTRAHRLHAAWRGRRPSPLLRHPMLPFTQPCHFSGRPATRFAYDNDRQVACGAAIGAAMDTRNVGRDRMAEWFGAEVVVRPDRMNEGVTNSGWIAVMHADGNGIGEILRSLTQLYQGDEFLDRLRDFSAALDRITREALAASVDQQPVRKDWLLPLVVGGDDVTAVMDGSIAFDVAAAFLQEFARRSAADPVITAVTARVAERGSTNRQPAGLTASAGIAYVKPHFPFDTAYQLAEELCRSAKQVKLWDPRCSALDFHVLHGSVGQRLEQLRQPPPGAAGSLRLWPGPVVVPGDGVATDGPARAHEACNLRTAVDALTPDRGDPPTLTRSAQHLLRQSLFRGDADLDRAREQVLSWETDPEIAAAAREFLDQHLRITEPGSDVEFTRLLGVIDLVDMKLGTAAGTPEERADVAREVLA